MISLSSLSKRHLIIPVANGFFLLLLVLDIHPILQAIVVFLSACLTLVSTLVVCSREKSASRHFQDIIDSQTQISVQRERYLIAIALHDSVVQLIFAIGMIADAMLSNESTYPGEVATKLKRLRLLTATTHTAIRHLLLELRPTHIDGIPFDRLITELVQIRQSCTDTDVQCIASGTASYPPDVHHALYQIVNLALSNSVFHAQASYILVRLFISPMEAIVTVEDDGMGFDPTAIRPGHFGLENIYQHARDIGALLTFDTLPGPNPKKVTCTWSQHNVWQTSASL